MEALMRILTLAILTNRDGLNRASGRPDVRSGLSGLPSREGGLRMPLHVAASVQRVGIGPRGTVFHQSIFCERASARGLLAASPRLLRLILGTASGAASFSGCC